MLENADTNQAAMDPAEYTYRDEPAQGLDLREIYAAIYRSRYILVGILVACLALGIAATIVTTRYFEGVATVEVRQEAEKVLGTEQNRENDTGGGDVGLFLDTQIDILKSRLITIAVAEQLGLFRNYDFLKTMKIEAEPEADGVLTEQEALRELVIAVLRKNLDVSYTGDTRILVITFTSPDPRLSSSVANSYAENYIRSNLQRKSDSSSYALEFLRGQLREAEARLGSSERASLEYARRTRIVDASNAAGSGPSTGSTQPQSLITAQLVQLNQAYSTSVADRVQAEQRWQRTRSGNPLNIPEVLSNPAVQGLLERRAVLESEYKEQLETRQESFPAVRQIQARLSEIDRQLDALARNIRSSVQSQYDIALQREKQLQSQLEDLKGRTLLEQNQSIQLSILRREAETNRQQYESLLRRFNQLNAESGVQANNLAIIDRAVPNPAPSWPKVPLNIAIALLLGFALCGAYLFIHLQLFDKIRTTVDVKERLGAALLGAIPISTDVMGDIRDQKSDISESFNLVRTGLSLSSDGGTPGSFMLTSTQASEGKSNSCVAIAIGFARLGKKVVLVDLDLRRPNIHKLLDLNNNIGASSVLSGQAEVASAIQHSSFDGLDVITGGPIPPSPTDLMMGHQLSALIAKLRETYDLVMIDSPPVLALADAEILANQVDAAVFVVESGRNSVKAVQTAMQRIARSGTRLPGVVLTKYDPGELGYGYTSDYSYVYSYGSRKGAGDE